jgi:hypothetical protein
MPAVLVACQRMVADERLFLLETLDRDYTQRLLGDDSAPPMAPALRSAVLPDADTHAQRELEAAVLLAASRARCYLRPWPSAAGWLTSRPGRLIRMVRPQPDGELVLHLEAAVLAPLMLELLPRLTDDGELAGRPGLRATVHRRHVELVQHGTDQAARVRLANVSYRAWSAALTFTEVARPEPNPLRWLGNDPTPLVPQELAALFSRPMSNHLTRLTSCLLRRIGLFATASDVCADALQPDQVRLRWCGELTAAAVATKLVHPIAGLPGDRFLVVPDDKRVTISCRDTGNSVELRPQGPGSDLPLTPSVVDVANAWRAWSQGMCVPGQWSDHLWARPR